MTVAGKTAYRVNGGSLIICLDRGITTEAIRAIIALVPKRVVCLDRCFGNNNALKTNTVLEMKSHNIQFQTA